MSQENVKERDLTRSVSGKNPGLYRNFDHSLASGGAPFRHVFEGRQTTASSGHRKNPKTGIYDSGGPFFTARAEASIPTSHVQLIGTDSPNHWEYSGPIYCAGLPQPYSTASVSRDSSYLDQAGAEAIAIVDPTNPNAQAGVALGEIIQDTREGRFSIPGVSAWKNRTEVLRAAGSEFLSAQFGWLPLISDIKNTHESIKIGNRIMENYSAGSGSLVHREFAFDDVITSSSSVIATTRCSTGDTGITEFRGTAVPVTRSRQTTTRRWFSGSFTYLGGGKDLIANCLGIESKFDRLFGLTLTPDVIWELTPWSWAIDWFSNAGNVISNMTSFGLAGLVMKYGYIMEETSIVDTYSMPNSGLSNLTLKSGGKVPDATLTLVTKRRRPANPFGFGVSWDGLSPTQLAITAALGITRL